MMKWLNVALFFYMSVTGNMDHKTIMEYCPRHRSLAGHFIEIDDFCGPIEEVDELEEKQYFRRLMGSNEIPLVYYGTDKNFHHVIFIWT